MLLHEHPSRDAAAFATAFTIRAGSRAGFRRHHTYLPPIRTTRVFMAKILMCLHSLRPFDEKDADRLLFAGERQAGLFVEMP
jgi:hypothetical protein